MVDNLRLDRLSAFARRRYGHGGLGSVLDIAAIFIVLGGALALVGLFTEGVFRWPAPVVGLLVLGVLEVVGVVHRRR